MLYLFCKTLFFTPTFIIEPKDYSADVITAKLKTGDEIFYDVVSMKQTKIDRKKEVSQDDSLKNKGSQVKETSFNKNIPQKNDGVNKESKVKTAKEVLEDPRFSRKKTVRGGAKAEARIKEVSENNGAAKENVVSFEEIPKKAQEYYNKKISSIVNEICKDFGILYFDKASVKTQLSELALDIFENDTIDVAHERKIFESISNSSSEGDNESLKKYYAQALKEISMASERIKKYQKETLRGSEDLGLIDKQRLDLAYVQKDRAQKALDGIDKKNLLSAKEKRWALSIAKKLDYGNNAPTGVIVDYANALKQKDDATNVITAYNTQRKQELLAEAILATENSEVWKDKQAGLLYARETQERNIMDIAKNDKEGAKLVKETYFDPVHKNEALGQQFIREYRQKVKKLNLTEAESVLVQAYGENIIDEIMLEGYEGNNKKINIKSEDGEDLYKRTFYGKNGNVEVKKVKNAVLEFKSIYSKMLTMANDVLEKNGYTPIKDIKEYFPHFSTKKGIVETVLAKVGLDLSNTDSLPEDIAGLSHMFKPGKTWFSSFLHRNGEKTDFDAVYGFDSYIEGIKDVIFHTEDIQRLRALETALRTKHTEAVITEKIKDIYAGDIPEGMKADEVQKLLEKNNSGRLNNYIVNLSDYIDVLSKKKAFADRQSERDFGRKIYPFMRTMEGRVASNMISYNVGSWLTNIIPLGQASGQIKTANLLKGMGQTIKAAFKNDGFANTSDFLINRKGTKRLSSSAVDKFVAAGVKPMEVIDSFVTQSIVRGKYLEEKSSGLSHDEAIKKANEATANIVADRSYGALPTIFNRRNPVTKLFTMFQVEVNNQFSNLFKDMPREAKTKGTAWLAAGLLKYMIAAFLYNEWYEEITGRRPALDPIGIAVLAIKDFNDPNIKKGDASLNLAQNVLEQTPFVGGVLGGSRVSVSSALPFGGNISNAVKGMGDLLFDESISPEYKKQLALKEITKPLWYLLPPGGGGEAKKVIEGVGAVNAGGEFGYDKKGNKSLKFAVDKTPTDYLSASLFGKYATKGGKEYVKNGFKGLSANATIAFENLVESGIAPVKAQKIVTDINAITSDVDSRGNTIEGSKEKKQMLEISKHNLSEDAVYGLYDDVLFSEGFKEMANTAVNDFGVNKSEFVDIYTKVKNVKGIKGENGKTIANSVGLQKKDIIDLAKINDKQKNYLYEMYNVGQKVIDGSVTFETIKDATGIDYSKDITGVSPNNSGKTNDNAVKIAAAKDVDVSSFRETEKFKNSGLSRQDYAYINERIGGYSEKVQWLQDQGLKDSDLINATLAFVMGKTAQAKMIAAFDEYGIANESYVEGYIFGYTTQGSKAQRNEQIKEYVVKNYGKNVHEDMYEWLKVSRGSGEYDSGSGGASGGGGRRSSGGRRGGGKAASAKVAKVGEQIKELNVKAILERSKLSEKSYRAQAAIAKKGTKLPSVPDFKSAKFSAPTVKEVLARPYKGNKPKLPKYDFKEIRSSAPDISKVEKEVELGVYLSKYKDLLKQKH